MSALAVGFSRQRSTVMDDETIVRLNIEHFRKLLATDLDETKRKMVLQLLAEEERKLAALQSAFEDRGPEPKA